MANLPMRDLGGVGVITDANPYDLPPNAFTSCNNVVFDENKILRSPIFKKLYSAPNSELTFTSVSGQFDANTATFENASGVPSDNIRFVSSYTTLSSGETILVCDRDGSVKGYPSGVLSFLTPVSGTLVTNDNPWTHCQVADISIIARQDMKPYGRNLTNDSRYAYLSGEWNTNDTCAVVRAYRDFLVALNISKAGVQYPTMVKWSNPLSYSQSVATIGWDPANPANVAGENIVGELRTPILDGLALGSQFVIYATDQVWLMEYTGSEYVFSFRKLFPTGGILNTNCVVEVEGKHFVFGYDDIYVHDGATLRTLSDGRIRRHVYNFMDKAQKNKFYTVHDNNADLIYFCYVSTQSQIGFPETQFCNRAAVYNYRDDTWSFMDLPNTAGGSNISYTTAASSYETVDAEYEAFNVNYESFLTEVVRVPAMVGVASTANSLFETNTYALDMPNIARVSLPVWPPTLKSCFVERLGLDLDEQDLPIRGYKTVKSVMPQIEAETDVPIIFKVGASDLPNKAPVYSTTYSFNSQLDYKIDTRASGRYLAYRAEATSIENFKFSAFDAEVVSLSKR